MRSVHHVIGCLIGGLALTMSALVAPAAADAKPRVALSASSSSVEVGQKVVLRGAVGLRSAGVIVKLQRKVGSQWRVVGSTRVSRAKKYSFTVRPAQGANVYRAKTVKTRALRSATSPSVTVRGVVRPVPPPQDLAVVRQVVLADVNQERTSRGLGALIPSAGIEGPAQTWAQHMAATGQLEHNPNYGDQIPGGWTKAAENIAAGPAPDNVVAVWMNSSGHRANILGDYTHTGIGYAVATDGTPYYVQVFAKY